MRIKRIIKKLNKFKNKHVNDLTIKELVDTNHIISKLSKMFWIKKFETFEYSFTQKEVNRLKKLGDNLK